MISLQNGEPKPRVTNRFVLDASALLASIFCEAGAEIVEAELSASVINTINLAEAATRMIDKGHDPADVERGLRRAQFRTISFDVDAAMIAARLRGATRHLGLSLGDRACLSTALALSLPVLTADRDWAKLDIGVDVRVIR